VSDTDELIAGALRDLAGQAVTVPPAADALWRAGRRRRRLGTVATSAAATAIAVAVGLTVTVGSSGAGHRVGSREHAAAPMGLSTPIVFKQVAALGRPPCPTSVNPATGRASGPPACIRYTGTEMAITRVESARVRQGPRGRYQLDIRMTPADARRFATLTRELAGLHSPRNRLAIVLNGDVLADRVVLTAITSGQTEIPTPGFPSKPQAEFFLATLIGG
jgi:hypothetical protein